MRPGSGTSLNSERAVIDLPLPDSPTMPRLSPGYSSKLTPSTALTMPPSVANCVFRSRTWRIGFAKLFSNAASARRLDDLSLAQRQRLAANEPCHVHPASGDDRDDDVVEAWPGQQQQDHGHEQVGNPVEDVDDERHDGIDHALVVAGDQADR